MSFVAYVGTDEIIVTTPKKEVECVREYFTEGGRSLDDYDREITREKNLVICIVSELRVR